MKCMAYFPFKSLFILNKCLRSGTFIPVIIVSDLSRLPKQTGPGPADRRHNMIRQRRISPNISMVSLLRLLWLNLEPPSLTRKFVSMTDGQTLDSSKIHVKKFWGNEIYKNHKAVLWVEFLTQIKYVRIDNYRIVPTRHIFSTTFGKCLKLHLLFGSSDFHFYTMSSSH